MVVKGYGQKPGKDHHEISSRVVMKNSVRLLMALAVQKRFKVRQMNVVKAYLESYLEEQVFMEIPLNWKKTLIKMEKERELPGDVLSIAEQWLEALK